MERNPGEDLGGNPAAEAGHVSGVAEGETSSAAGGGGAGFSAGISAGLSTGSSGDERGLSVDERGSGDVPNAADPAGKAPLPAAALTAAAPAPAAAQTAAPAAAAAPVEAAHAAQADQADAAPAPAVVRPLLVETVDASVVFSYLKSARIKYTAVAASRRWVALGASTGSVYIFQRGTGAGTGAGGVTGPKGQLQYRQMVANNDGDVTALAFAANDNVLAIGTAKGVVLTLELNLDSSKEKTKVRVHASETGAVPV